MTSSIQGQVISNAIAINENSKPAIVSAAPSQLVFLPSNSLFNLSQIFSVSENTILQGLQDFLQAIRANIFNGARPSTRTASFAESAYENELLTLNDVFAHNHTEELSLFESLKQIVSNIFSAHSENSLFKQSFPATSVPLEIASLGGIGTENFFKTNDLNYSHNFAPSDFAALIQNQRNSPIPQVTKFQQHLANNFHRLRPRQMPNEQRKPTTQKKSENSFLRTIFQGFTRFVGKLLALRH